MKYDSLAAVDLGSNSFHLQIGRVVGDQIYPLDALREPVRLGGGLSADKSLDEATQTRALETLARFGERLRGMPAGRVRAVGTNALRQARNSRQFLRRAQLALGFPIEIIFGREEARLIYLGVSHSLPLSPERRLVFDIGGGSTEFIIGTGFEAELMESLPMGSVSYTLRFFAQGRVDQSAMKKAQLAAINEVQTLVSAYQQTGWREIVASSGTAKAIASILSAKGWSEQGICARGLQKLRAYLIEAGDVDRVELASLRADRRQILPAGVAIMSAIFEALEIESVEISDAALRQGVLYDLLGRFQHYDMRVSTVDQFVHRYHVDSGQRLRVSRLALQLYDIFVPVTDENDRMLLEWAAQLHEIGLSIAHAGYHKHSAYILSNADMPGFSQDEQDRLARIVLAHRGKLSKVENPDAPQIDWALILCLRLAALFHRSRTDARLPSFDCKPFTKGFVFSLPGDWLEAHPLSAAALESEAEEWRSVGFEMRVETT